jgi:hypothetical protein
MSSSLARQAELVDGALFLLSDILCHERWPGWRKQASFPADVSKGMIIKLVQ